MRVHRLKVVNFRGVVEREVVFADAGVTVIEGENEAGKSSMVEALDLLLTTRDKSSKASVRSVQPSGRDVGSEVTAEISCGPWRFEYFKRFNKAPETALTILEPKAEQLTGRAAHERVEQILDASLDRTLYRALSLLQSTDPELGALTDSSALSRALDRAAGDVDVEQAGESPQTQDLLAAVTAEYQRYFTAAQGRPTGELLAAERAAHETSDAVAERERILAAVQEATDRLPGVAAAIAELSELESEQRVEVARLAAEVAQADAVVEKLDKSKAVVAQRQAEATTAAKAVNERKGLRARLGQAESDVASGRAAVESSRNDARAAAQRAEELDIEATAAQERLAGLRERIVAAEAAEVVARDHRRRAELDSTLAEAARLQEELDEAVKAASDLVATDADAARAVDLDRTIAAAQARVDAGAPTVIVTPLGGAVTVDGEPVTDETTVKAGHTVSVDAAEVRVRVVPGDDAQALADELEALRDEATELVRRCGVRRLSDVVPAAARRTEAHGRVREVERALRRELGENSVDELTAERALVDARIPDVEPEEVDDLGALRIRERDAANAHAAAERARDVESSRAREHTSRAEVWEKSGERAAETAVALREELMRAVAEASDA
ncbi:MAG: AAA family ATPase, partial [Gordonia sp. (in: high G+C Gram-positive bacteria)]|nr:AAA family ATPase [Gordonia sp. (in: high G+C Gram-positive bacteria)]